MVIVIVVVTVSVVLQNGYGRSFAVLCFFSKFAKQKSAPLH